MITKDKKLFYFESFESITEFLNTIEKRPTNTFFKDYEQSKRTDDYFCEFSGTKSYEDASELLLKGDMNLRNELQKLKTPTKITAEKYTNKYSMKIERSVCGIFPHVPSYLAGDPNCMINVRRTQIKNKIVNIAIDTAVSYLISADAIKQTALYIFSGIKALEKSGYRANVYIYLTLEDRSKKKQRKKICFRLKVKSSTEIFNELKLLYPIVHPSFFRRHLFRWIETIQDFKIDTFTKSYGTVSCIAKDDNLMKVAKIKKEDTIILWMQELVQQSQDEIIKEITKNRL